LGAGLPWGGAPHARLAAAPARTHAATGLPDERSDSTSLS
jgi:hypothetical protein